MFSNHSRVLAFTSALFLAGLTIASAGQTVQNVSQHGAQPHSHGFMSSQGHGMIQGQKHGFVSSHHFTSQKPGHGFTSSVTNKRKH